MGSLACRTHAVASSPLPHTMAPMGAMKAMKAAKAAKAGAKMSKTGIAQALAAASGDEVKASVCNRLLDNLASIAAAEVKKTGKFVIPGVTMIKTRRKPATKAGKRMAFGQEVFVKAKPARTIVKAYPVSALKKSI